MFLVYKTILVYKRSLKVHPARPWFSHSILTKGLTIVHPFCIPESCTTNDVDDDKEYEHDYVDHWNLPPTMLDAGENPSFTWVTLQTQWLLIVAPFCAVHVIDSHPCSRNPECFIYIGIAARCWRLAAPRLRHKQSASDKQSAGSMVFMHLVNRKISSICHRWERIKAHFI